MNKAQEVKDIANKYFGAKELSCCESCVKAIKDAYELPFDDEILKLATGLAGGIGGQGCICGALSGAVMGLGLIYGRSVPGADRSQMMQLGKELYEHFEENFSFFCCRTQLKDFASKDAPEARAHCTNLIESMLDKACELIEREGLPE